jgi:hypothetical protein
MLDNLFGYLELDPNVAHTPVAPTLQCPGGVAQLRNQSCFLKGLASGIRQLQAYCTTSK